VPCQVPWTQALRTIVLNCYRHHGREDLLPNFPADPVKPTLFQLTSGAGRTLIQAISNPDGSTSYVAIDTGDADAQEELVTLADGTNARVLHAVCVHFSMLLSHPPEVWARECCRISLSYFLAKCRKKRLNQSSFVLLCFASFVFSAGFPHILESCGFFPPNSRPA